MYFDHSNSLNPTFQVSSTHFPPAFMSSVLFKITHCPICPAHVYVHIYDHSLEHGKLMGVQTLNYSLFPSRHKLLIGPQLDVGL